MGKQDGGTKRGRHWLRCTAQAALGMAAVEENRSRQKNPGVQESCFQV